MNPHPTLAVLGQVLQHNGTAQGMTDDNDAVTRCCQLAFNRIPPPVLPWLIRSRRLIDVDHACARGQMAKDYVAGLPRLASRSTSSPMRAFA